jgi:hypothetical protein
MSRMFAVAAILSLTLGAAQAADSLDSRIHDAAVTACASESSASLPASHYAAITQACVNRLSSATMRKMQAEALAKTEASTASLVTN